MIKKKCLFLKSLLRSSIILLVIMALVETSLGQKNSASDYPPLIHASKAEIFKSVDGIELYLWIFNPKNHQDTDYRPAIVFFFGGGWRDGTPNQFVRHCEYLANRGMVAMVADYRVASRHGVKAEKCVADAKSAIRWVRSNAKALGIDPERIAAAGGHLALATATLPRFDDPQDNTSVSAKPNALVLFNPAVLLAPVKDEWEILEERQNELRERMDVDPVEISPYHHITTGIGPTIIFHGIEDTTVPYKTVDLFRKKMRKNLNRCELIGYHGQKHGFFNYGKNNNGPFVDTVNKMDAFLCSIGYLVSPPENIHQK